MIQSEYLQRYVQAAEEELRKELSISELAVMVGALGTDEIVSFEVDEVIPGCDQNSSAWLVKAAYTFDLNFRGQNVTEYVRIIKEAIVAARNEARTSFGAWAEDRT